MDIEFNADKVKANLDALPKLIEDAVWDATFDIVELVETRAVDHIQGSVKHSDGELARSLKHEVLVDSKGSVVGRVWSDDPVAAYREFGTGVHGQESEKDMLSDFVPHYRQTPWFIPAEDVPALDKIYGMRAITIKGRKFYMTSGQPARQFLTPAIRETVKNNAKDLIRDRIRDALKGGLVT